MVRLLLLIIGLGIFPGVQIHVWGQFSAPVPPVTIDMRHTELADILTELEKQTGLFFSYESSLLTDLPKVTLTAEEESFSYCLRKLFASLPLTYRITGQYIILKARPRSYTVSGFVRDSSSYESLISATVVDRYSRKGTTTNSYGFYNITLPAGPVSLFLVIRRISAERNLLRADPGYPGRSSPEFSQHALGNRGTGSRSLFGTPEQPVR
ncbi:MAG: hypothetical protein LUG96_16545 [Tannerellaceae bacterium]|nr:hypothetical protein [Tannerellaceae bacterium]